MPDPNPNRILWLDLETTGLKCQIHSILEAAAVITDNDLMVLGSVSAVVHQPPHILEMMNNWCTKTHTGSGLVAEVQASETSLDDAEDAILSLIEANDAEQCVLAGNSISFDRGFIQLHMPKLNDALHYRNIDVRQFIDLAERWCPDLGIEEVQPTLPHRAMPDILASLATLLQIKIFISEMSNTA